MTRVQVARNAAEPTEDHLLRLEIKLERRSRIASTHFRSQKNEENRKRMNLRTLTDESDVPEAEHLVGWKAQPGLRRV